MQVEAGPATNDKQWPQYSARTKDDSSGSRWQQREAKKGAGGDAAATTTTTSYLWLHKLCPVNDITSLMLANLLSDTHPLNQPQLMQQHAGSSGQAAAAAGPPGISHQDLPGSSAGILCGLLPAGDDGFTQCKPSAEGTHIDGDAKLPKCAATSLPSSAVLGCTMTTLLPEHLGCMPVPGSLELPEDWENELMMSADLLRDIEAAAAADDDAWQQQAGCRHHLMPPGSSQGQGRAASAGESHVLLPEEPPSLLLLQDELPLLPDVLPQLPSSLLLSDDDELPLLPSLLLLPEAPPRPFARRTWPLMASGGRGVDAEPVAWGLQPKPAAPPRQLAQWGAHSWPVAQAAAEAEADDDMDLDPEHLSVAEPDSDGSGHGSAGHPHTEAEARAAARRVPPKLERRPARDYGELSLELLRPVRAYFASTAPLQARSGALPPRSGASLLICIRSGASLFSSSA